MATSSPDESIEYGSPESKSHACPYPTSAQPTLDGGADTKRTAVAPRCATTLAHVVLKWLQWWLGYKVRLWHWLDARHRSEHTARLSTVPGELTRYALERRSHAWPRTTRAVGPGTGGAGTVVGAGALAAVDVCVVE